MKHAELFTEDEYQKIIVIACSAPGGASKEQIFRTMRVLEEAKVSVLFLDSVMAGVLVVKSFEGDEPLFGPPTTIPKNE